MTPRAEPRILITGASGQLGSYLVNHLSAAPGLAAWSGRSAGLLFGVPLRPVDLSMPDQVARALAAGAPEVIIHAAALSSVSACYEHPESAQTINVEGTRHLVGLASDRGARLIFVSTDLVFDGEQAPYDERSAAAPLSVYGRSKLAAEDAVLAAGVHSVVRVSLLFGPSRNGRSSFFDRQMASLRDQLACPLFDDEWRTPLSLETAACELSRLAREPRPGLWHLGGPERMSRLEMGRRLCAVLQLKDRCLVPVARAEAGAPERRPRDVSLDSSRWRQAFPDARFPDWEDALKAMLQ